MSSEEEFEEFADRGGPFCTDTHALVFLFLENFDIEDSLKYLFHDIAASPQLISNCRKFWKRLKKSCFDANVDSRKLVLQVSYFVSKLEQDLVKEDDFSKVCRFIKTDLFDLLHHPLIQFDLQ